MQRVDAVGQRAGAQPHEAARHAGEQGIGAEVLGAGGGFIHHQNVLFPKRLKREIDKCVIVDDAGIALFAVNVYLAAGNKLNALCNGTGIFINDLCGLVVVVAENAAGGCKVRDDVDGGAAGNGADGENGGSERVNVAGDDLLEQCDELAERKNGVVAVLGLGAVRGLAVNIEAVHVKAAGDDAALDGEGGVSDIGRLNVHGDDGVHMGVFHAAVPDHRLCAAGGVVGVGGFLGRLENELYAALELISVLAQQACGGEQRGDVQVMAAGVHDAGVFGAELKAGFLDNGQSVGIGADGETFALAELTLDKADNAGVPHLLDLVNAVLLELFHNERAGALLLEGKLGVSVDILADGLHFGIVFFDCFFEHE